MGKQKELSEVCHYGSLPGPEEIKRTTSRPRASTSLPGELKAERWVWCRPMQRCRPPLPRPRPPTWRGGGGRSRWPGLGRRGLSCPGERGEGRGGKGGAAVPGSAAPGQRRYSLGVTNASAAGAQRERRERGGEAAGMLGRGALSPRPCPGFPSALPAASSARDPRAPRRPVDTEGGHLGAREGTWGPRRAGNGREWAQSSRTVPTQVLCVPCPVLPGPGTRAQQPRGLRPPLGPWGKGVLWAPRDLGAQNREWPTGPRQGLSLLGSCRTLASGRPEVCGPGSPTASVFLVL